MDSLKNLCLFFNYSVKKGRKGGTFVNFFQFYWQKTPYS